MLRKGLTVLAMALFVSPLFADIELTTSINDVFHRGSNELAGSITMTVNANDFNNVSTSEPVFIRITLDHNAVLANTHVNLDFNPVTEPRRSRPIYLAMNLNLPNSTSQTLAAPEETVSIVRWVAGESSLWIRVQAASGTWIDSNGDLIGDEAPEPNRTVSWTFGNSAQQSWNRLFDISDTLKNLPFNTRDIGAVDRTLSNNLASAADYAVSTLICVDLTGSDLEISGIESLLNYDPIAFDDTAQGNSPGSFRRGDDTGINFTNDFSIARGRDRDCDVRIIGKGGFAVLPLCVERAVGQNTQEGFLRISNSLEFEIDCRRGGNFLTTELFPGSFFRFSTGGRGNYGFDTADPNAFTSSDALVTSSLDAPVPGTGFSNNGRTLYRSIDIIWNGSIETLDQFEIEATVYVNYHFSEGPVDVVLDWSIYLVNHDGELDEDPFDGVNADVDRRGVIAADNDQWRRCPPSQFLIATGEWDFGAFVECIGESAVLFFPYMPKLQGGTLFWSGLSLVNQGFVDFGDNEVQAIIYQENGDRFTADFPELPVRNQYTWLLIDDPEQGPAFFRQDSDQVVVPVPSDPAVDPASFGETRMNMFVVGSFNATFFDEIFAGDLDGYLLIGKEGDVDGSYLPRNYDNDIPGQNADLPLRRSKNGNAETTFVKSLDMGDTEPTTYRFANGKWMNK